MYEIPLLPFVSPEGLSKITSIEEIVDYIFELHSDVITPRVIARRQVSRLVERVVLRHKEYSPNKENTGAKNNDDKR